MLYCLMQAKIEPGNVNCIQISPTLQAIKSNYSCVHSGKLPNYLKYFVNESLRILYSISFSLNREHALCANAIGI
ncbi:NDP-hexose 2,3-dehydratase family protein [Bacteroides oleiciplenus]|uniref:NDP-hexose 2,3-dehydratase family protein n=1 Tax=Bacteroides oleiciplenus TaxID=626931 RepID=UPI001FCBD2F8|nr:NDP-hexose 2,3-dehydratase family protein [Bacteroides oleiciplenus]